MENKLVRAWIWGRICVNLNVAVEGDPQMGLLILEALSLQTNFLNADLTI